jgi:membrane-associated PAP2 superfamily phosphatase
LNDPTSIKVKYLKGIGLSLLVFTVLVLLTWVALALDVDMKVSTFFFNKETGWTYKDIKLIRALYLFGTMPGLALTLIALSITFLGFIQPKWREYQKQMLVIVLTTILGAGVLVNGILKPYCGRPRPREVTVFSGQWEFCSPCFNDAPGKGLSFPCGHCTMGFLFVTLIYLRRRSPAIAYGGAAFGVFYGILMGIARAAQGAHFVTDTLWSFGVLVIVSLLLYYILIPRIERSWLKARTLSPRQIFVTGICAVLLMGGITLGFLTRRPYYEMTSRQLSLPTSVKQIIVHSNIALVNRRIDYKNKTTIVALLSQGFGWAEAEEMVDIIFDFKDDTLNLEIVTTQDGYFAELQHQLFLTLPATLKNQINVSIKADEAPGLN